MSTSELLVMFMSKGSIKSVKFMYGKETESRTVTENGCIPSAMHPKLIRKNTAGFIVPARMQNSI